MFVETQPSCSTRMRCTGWVSGMGMLRIRSNANVLRRAPVAVEGGALLGLAHLVHDALPRALADFGIGGGEVGAGDVEVAGGLAIGLVAGVQEDVRLALVGGAQAGLATVDRVLAIERATASKQGEPWLHFRCARILAASEPTALAGSGRVSAEQWRSCGGW